jgi:arginyl-tRNA synthetase
MKNPIVREIAQVVSAQLGVPEDEVLSMITAPPSDELGDYALPCFAFAQTQKRLPHEIAKELAAALAQAEHVTSAEAAGPYVNITVNRAQLLCFILSEILTQGERYGGSDEGCGKTVVIDYSSPNIARPFSIAHLRSTALGHSLKRIFRHLGYHVVGVNHLGDWGTQFGALIVAYKRWGSRERVEKENVYELFRLYVRFHEEAEKNPELEEEARAWFKRLEEGDSEALELWQWFVDLSWQAFQRYYEILGIEFEEVRGESAYRDQTRPLIEELLKKGIARESQGAIIIPLGNEGEEMPPLLLRKRDGTTLYATRDLAAAIYHYQTYRFHKKLYVVGAEQSLHFKQLFKVLELMGHPWAKGLVHVAFGMVLFEDKKMSTRQGRVIFLEEVIQKATQRTREIIESIAKTADLTEAEKDQVAQDVGVSAVVYAQLSRSRTQDLHFRWEEVLSFEGKSGPYVQYTHARMAGVLRKASDLPQPETVDYGALTHPNEVALAKKLELFPQKVQQAAEGCDPFVIADYLADLAAVANKFYDTCRVLGEESAVERARLALVQATKTVLKTGLELLGMKAPERM